MTMRKVVEVNAFQLDVEFPDKLELELERRVLEPLVALLGGLMRCFSRPDLPQKKYNSPYAEIKHALTLININIAELAIRLLYDEENKSNSSSNNSNNDNSINDKTKTNNNSSNNDYKNNSKNIPLMRNSNGEIRTSRSSYNTASSKDRCGLLFIGKNLKISKIQPETSPDYETILQMLIPFISLVRILSFISFLS